ncbi:hypothetical protein QR680_013077 [Steinernema hermaphroditum]|uniref:Uncharacterized protein n=1 Tax=Steinernema hermaphroditum TaxID=289476 RepID=A0AA39I739_9BILA|nr:hypothetical protein QR680_013077 [Steinernema hermaphroditum]
MEAHLERIRKLASELFDLHECRRSGFARSSQAVSTVDEIIAKMEFLKEVVQHEEGMVVKRVPHRLSVLQRRSNFVKNASTVSSVGTLITHATINGETHLDVKQAANRLYDVENYSKCVRLIEKILPTETDQELLLLCHGSYKHMLADAADTREASKLCEWWKTFIEKVEAEKSCQDFRLEILECLAECLWETSRLPLLTGFATAARQGVMDDLMITKVELFQRTRVDYRPFHVKYLRRIEHICFILADYFSAAEDGHRLPRYIHMGITVVSEALTESKEDEKKYRLETGGQCGDTNLVECCKLLQDMTALLTHIEAVELTGDRCDDSQSSRTSGLGTPLSTPDYAVEDADDDGKSITLHQQRTQPYRLTHSNQILTTAEVHVPQKPTEVNNNDVRPTSDLNDDESFILHL